MRDKFGETTLSASEWRSTRTMETRRRHISEASSICCPSRREHPGTSYRPACISSRSSSIRRCRRRARTEEASWQGAITSSDRCPWREIERRDPRLRKAANGFRICRRPPRQHQASTPRWWLLRDGGFSSADTCPRSIGSRRQGGCSAPYPPDALISIRKGQQNLSPTIRDRAQRAVPPHPEGRSRNNQGPRGPVTLMRTGSTLVSSASASAKGAAPRGDARTHQGCCSTRVRTGGGEAHPAQCP